MSRKPHVRRRIVAAAILVPSPLLATTYDLSNTTVNIATSSYTAADTLNCTAVTFTSTVSGATLPAALNLLTASRVDTTLGVTLTGALSGPGAFQKFSTGSLTLTAPSPSFTGPVAITTGVNLRLADPTALGPASAPSPITMMGTIDASGSLPARPVFLDGATLSNNTATPVTIGPAMPAHTFSNNFTLAGSGDLTFSSPLLNASTLTKSGTGTATYSTPTKFSSGITISAGTLRLGIESPFTGSAALTANSGATLDLNGFNSPGNGFTMNAGSSLLNNNTSATSTLSSSGSVGFNLGGAGNINYTVKFTNLAKVGTGTLTLSGGNGGFTGTATINDGTVKFNTATALGNSASSHFNLNGTSPTGGILDLNGYPAPAGTYTYNGGALYNNNPSTPSTIAGSITFSSGGTNGFSLGGDGDLVSSVTLPNSFAKAGTGTLALNQPQSFTNTTFVLDGTLRLATTGSYSGSLTIVGSSSINNYRYAALDLNGRASTTLSLSMFNNAGIINNNTTTPVTLDSNLSITYSNLSPPVVAITLGGDGTLNVNNSNLAGKILNKVGAGLLTLPSSFTPTSLNLRSGTLQVESNSQLGSSLNFLGGTLRVAPLYLAPQTSYTFTPPISLDPAGGTIDTQRNTTLTGHFSGTGALTKAGTATLTLSNSPGQSIDLAVSAGTLRFSTNLSGATIGALAIAPGATLDLATTSLTTAIPAATLRPQLQDARLTSSLVDATHRLAYSGDPAGPILVKLTLAGDANLDGILNADDYALLDRGLAAGGSTWTQGDFNYDGSVTAADYLLIDQAYFTQAPGFSPEFLASRESHFGSAYVSELLSMIPEPSPCPILYPLSSLLLTRRRPQR